jgi:hypothetical protein
VKKAKDARAAAEGPLAILFRSQLEAGAQKAELAARQAGDDVAAARDALRSRDGEAGRRALLALIPVGAVVGLAAYLLTKGDDAPAAPRGKGAKKAAPAPPAPKVDAQAEIEKALSSGSGADAYERLSQRGGRK